MTGRLAALRSLLTEQNLAAAIVAKPENRLYFSGFTGSAGMLVISQTTAKLVTDFRYSEQAGRQAPDFAVVRHGTDLYATIADEVKAIGGGKIGFESDFVTWDAYRRLSEFGGELVPLHLDKLRMVKDEGELAALRQAVRIADDAYTHIQPLLRPGASEWSIALELEYFMRRQGAERIAFDIIVASGTRSALPHGRASDKLIAAGDFVTMDFGAVYGGYHSDITRTVVVGKASPRQREVYAVVKAAQAAGLAAVVAGRTCRDADAAARKVIIDAGYGEYFGHGLGHGVGLAIHEEPRVSPVSDVTLAAGMTVTVEPGVYIPDWGGVRIEDTVVVTTAGAQILTASGKELIELD